MKKLTTEQFIEKAKKVHGDKYDYSNSIYIGSNKHIEIFCEIHKDVKIIANAHLQGRGCPKCGNENSILKQRMSKEEFIKKANLVHKNKYDYSFIDYKGVKNKIEVICPEHGRFYILPNQHLYANAGCQKCGITGWSLTTWKKRALESNYFDSFKLYIIQVYNKDEKFIKIGRTYTSLEKRFSILKNYNVKVIKVIKGDCDYIFNLEIEFKNKFKKYKYVPNIKFEGYTECYNEKVLEKFCQLKIIL